MMIMITANLQKRWCCCSVQWREEKMTMYRQRAGTKLSSVTIPTSGCNYHHSPTRME